MRKPIIVVTPARVWADIPGFGKISSVRISGSEMSWIRRNGMIPIMPDMMNAEDADAVMQIADGLFMTGGADVDPSMYGEETRDDCGETEPERDISDSELMKAAMKYNKPIIAVCRGSQMGNVVLGGKLYQHIPAQRPSNIEHVDIASFREETAHEVNVIPGTPLDAIMEDKTFRINTTHHQGVKEAGKNVVIQAKAPDGMVESWYLDDPDLYVRGYQWHPEGQNPNIHEQTLINDFIKAVKERMGE